MKPGNYKGRVIEAAMCRANSGTDYVGAIFIVFDDAGVEVGRVTWSGYLTDKTSERTAASLRALGWDGTVDDNGTISSLTKTVPIGVIEEEYKGRLNTKIDWVGEPPFGASLRREDRLTLSQAKSQVASLQRLCGVGGGSAPAEEPRF